MYHSYWDLRYLYNSHSSQKHLFSKPVPFMQSIDLNQKLIQRLQINCCFSFHSQILYPNRVSLNFTIQHPSSYSCPNSYCGAVLGQTFNPSTLGCGVLDWKSTLHKSLSTAHIMSTSGMVQMANLMSLQCSLAVCCSIKWLMYVHPWNGGRGIRNRAGFGGCQSHWIVPCPPRWIWDKPVLRQQRGSNRFPCDWSGFGGSVLRFFVNSTAPYWNGASILQPAQLKSWFLIHHLCWVHPDVNDLKLHHPPMAHSVASSTKHIQLFRLSAQ